MATVNPNDLTLTRYGLGKFTFNVDAFVHGMDVDEEQGDCETTGWYGLYLGDFTPDTDYITVHSLGADDVEYLKAHHGAIARETSQGFVYVEFYLTEDEAKAQWANISRSFAEDEPEEDEDDAEDNSCNQCKALMIQGVFCHETGCPNKGKTKVDGEWITEEEDELEDEYEGQEESTEDDEDEEPNVAGADSRTGE